MVQEPVELLRISTTQLQVVLPAERGQRSSATEPAAVQPSLTDRGRRTGSRLPPQAALGREAPLAFEQRADLANRCLHRRRRCVENEVGAGRWLVRRVDPGEVADLAGADPLIEALRVARLDGERRARTRAGSGRTACVTMSRARAGTARTARSAPTRQWLQWPPALLPARRPAGAFASRDTWSLTRGSPSRERGHVAIDDLDRSALVRSSAASASAMVDLPAPGRPVRKTTCPGRAEPGSRDVEYDGRCKGRGRVGRWARRTRARRAPPISPIHESRSRRRCRAPMQPRRSSTSSVERPRGYSEAEQEDREGAAGSSPPRRLKIERPRKAQDHGRSVLRPTRPPPRPMHR